MNRRNFLRYTAIASGSALLSSSGWMFRSTAQAQTQTAPSRRLIVVFLRGAVDGLNVVVPYQEAAYYQARPNIAIPQPGKVGGVLDLDHQFGLHPALASLMPFWQQGNLAFVHACGSPDPTRSHFDAQDYMESGTPGTKTTPDGWMNRLLGQLSNHSPVQAVSLGAITPRILSGQMPVANLNLGKNASRALPLDRAQVSAAFDRLYSGKDALSQAYQEGKTSRQAFLNDLDSGKPMSDVQQPARSDLNTEMQQANNGAPLPNGLTSDARQLAHMMVADPRIELAFLALGGWDTHVNQGGSQGQLATRLQALGQGIATLAQSLGSVYSNTTILVMSEFGRTVHENGNGGTDHGHGNVMWVMGGNVHGGKIYGEWTGLAASQLHEGRDLEVTTDFRNVILPVLGHHFQLDDTKLSQIFPQFTPTQLIQVI